MPHDIDTIKSRITELGIVPPMFAKKELIFLAETLDDEEQLLSLAQGMYRKNMGILAVTPKRVMFISKGLFSSQYEEFPLKNISSIQFDSSLMNSKIKIFVSGNSGEIEKVTNGEAKHFVETVKQLQSDISTKANTGPAPGSSNDDIYARLEKLGKLKESGVLTEDEFLTEKKKLLG